jgi:tetratricopeptide (TPR) repeat protein
VRPLLPGDGGCLVLVTSRRRLKALDDAQLLPLDVLPLADAVALFRTVAKVGPAQVDDPLVAEIVELCARLPLALRIAAALLRHRPAWEPAHLAGLLRDGRERITALADGDADVGAVFDLSYRNLDARHRLLFRRLGLIPGPATDAHAAAALIDTGPADAARQLEHLVDQNLLIQRAPHRYVLHDLLRLHAQALAEAEAADERDAALERLLDYYEHTANRAEAIVSIHPGRVPSGSACAYAPTFADETAARAWLRAERPNLVAALNHAIAHGLAARHVGLAAGLGWVLRADGPWSQSIETNTTAAAAAERLGDDLGRADALIRLAIVRLGTGDLDGARGHLHVALELYRGAADELGQASALVFLGETLRMTGDADEAMRHLREAEELYRALGDKRGQATALVKSSHICHLRADHEGAVRDLQAALRLSKAVDDQRGQATALTYLGLERREAGAYEDAARDFREALALYHSTGERVGQAQVLTYSGEMLAMTGDAAGAVGELEQALAIYRALGERQGQMHALACLGDAERSRGDLPTALRLLKESLDLLRSIGSRSNECWLLLRYAAVVVATGDHERALAIYEDVLRLAEELNQPGNAAEACEGIGDCHLLAGDTDGAATYLARAAKAFQHLGIASEAARVQTKLTASAAA